MIDQKQLENVEYFNYLGIMITIDARFTRRRLSTSKLDVHIREKSNEVLPLVHSFV